MPVEWAEVELLMRELGAVRVSAFAARASSADYVLIEEAIARATQAVVVTLDDPRNTQAVDGARRAIATARELIARLASEIDRARRNRERAAELGVEPRPRPESER